MLTITYNGHNIPLDSGFTFRLTYVNPACYFDEVPGNYGIGIDIPVNDYSRMYFGNPHRFERYSSTGERKFPNVEIRFSGMLLMSGTLNITNATDEIYSCWLQSRVGVIGEEQREKLINELQLPDEQAPWDKYNGQTFENKDDYDEDTDDYCTGEHHNRRFWEEIGKTVQDTEEYYEDNEKKTREIEISRLSKAHRDSFNYLVNKTINGMPITTGEGCVLSAFLFLKFLLAEVLKRCGFYIDDENNAFANELAEYRNIAIYNNFNLMIPTLTTKNTEQWEQDMNTGDWISTGYTEITSMIWGVGEDGKFDYVHLIPGVNVGKFILGIQNLLNVVFIFRNDNRVNIIDRLSSLTMAPYDLSGYFLGEWIIGERKKTTMKFISEYDKNDAAISDRFHDLSERRKDFGDDVYAVEDLALLTPNYGEIRYVIFSDEWYEYKWDTGETNSAEEQDSEFDKVGWVLSSIGYQPALYGEGDEIEEIRTNICIPYTYRGSGFISKLQNGAILPMRNLWNNFSPCMFFYNGDNNIGTMTNTSEYSLKWIDQFNLNKTGLFDKRWKLWADFWINRLPVEGDFDFPLNVLHYLINNITDKFRTRNGDFIIEEMDIEFGVNKIGKTHIKGYKL